MRTLKQIYAQAVHKTDDLYDRTVDLVHHHPQACGLFNLGLVFLAVAADLIFAPEIAGAVGALSVATFIGGVYAWHHEEEQQKRKPASPPAPPQVTQFRHVKTAYGEKLRSL